MKRTDLRFLALGVFAAIAAIAAATGCPVFRNPASYTGAGGIVGYLKYVVDAHRKP